MNNKTARPVAFVVASTNHGSMIVNRYDYKMIDAVRGYGLGFQLLNTSSFDQPEIDLVMQLSAQ